MFRGFAKRSAYKRADVIRDHLGMHSLLSQNIYSISPLFYSPPPIPYQCYDYLLLVRLGEANFAKSIRLTSLILIAILLVG
jgi:hypothetical protein